MYNELIKKISEAETPFQPMQGDELAKIEAEEDAKFKAEEKARVEKLTKALAVSLVCPSCGVDMREEGINEDASQYVENQYIWREGRGWEFQDSDSGDSDHLSWKCRACGDEVMEEDIDPEGVLFN